MSDAPYYIFVFSLAFGWMVAHSRGNYWKRQFESQRQRTSDMQDDHEAEMARTRDRLVGSANLRVKEVQRELEREEIRSGRLSLILSEIAKLARSEEDCDAGGESAGYSTDCV